MLDYSKIMSKVNTCQDWLNLLDNPDIDSIDLGYYLSNYKYDSTPYTYLGNIPLDIKYNEAELLGTSSCMASEYKRVAQFNYFHGYDKYAITEDCKLLIEKRLGFAIYHATFNIQTPNNITRLHFDVMSSFLSTHGAALDTIPFDINRLQPVGDKLLRRLFIALSDWQDGWIFQIGKEQWSGWKKGDVIDFNWRHAPHSTANAGFATRALLKITGYSSFIDQLIEEGKTL
jgi:hypothetical protein